MKSEILQLQHDLQRDSYGYETTTMTPAEVLEYIGWNFKALLHEIMEAEDETSWKPWATSKYVRRIACLQELIDVAHFYNNIWLAVSGLEPEEAADLFDAMYRDKNHVNAKRQAEGYDGVTGKCPHCKRALDTGDTKEATDEDGVKLRYCICGFVVERDGVRADA